VLDEEEVLAGCEIHRIGGFEFIDIGIVIIHSKCRDFEIVVADNPELQPVPGLTGCVAMP